MQDKIEVFDSTSTNTPIFIDYPLGGLLFEKEAETKRRFFIMVLSKT